MAIGEKQLVWNELLDAGLLVRRWRRRIGAVLCQGEAGKRRRSAPITGVLLAINAVDTIDNGIFSRRHVVIMVAHQNADQVTAMESMCLINLPAPGSRETFSGAIDSGWSTARESLAVPSA